MASRVEGAARVQSKLRGIAGQVQYATARALTKTAKDAQAEVTRQIPQRFDRPTPFTQRAIGITPATKATLSASVFVKDKQAEYLALEETGGTRHPKKRALVLPRDARLNQYGNLPRGSIQRLLARPDVFSGKVGTVAGIWQRITRGKNKGQTKLLVAYQTEATYKPRFHFRDTVLATARRVVHANFVEALREALRTAR